MQEIDYMTRSRREEGGRGYRNRILVDATLQIAGELAGSAVILSHISPAYTLDPEQIAQEAKQIASACIRALRDDGAL